MAISSRELLARHFPKATIFEPDQLTIPQRTEPDAFFRSARSTFESIDAAPHETANPHSRTDDLGLPIDWVDIEEGSVSDADGPAGEPSKTYIVEDERGLKRAVKILHGEIFDDQG